MQFFNEILNEEVEKIKQEIRDLDSELKQLKFDAKIDNEKATMKLETVEKTNLEVINEMNDKENSVNFPYFPNKTQGNQLEKTEKVIDEVCTVVSRILYQLQGKSSVFQCFFNENSLISQYFCDFP